MCANTAPAPVVLGPSPPPPHNPLSTHCRQLTTPAPAMPVIAAVSPPRRGLVLRNQHLNHEKSSPSIQQSQKNNPSTSLSTSSTTNPTNPTNPSSLTPSPKPQPKDSSKTPTTCEGCSQPHDGSYGSGRFCSVHCARRIAASRKWEKQRSQRKRAAAAAAAAPSATADHSTSSLSSASSDDLATQKRQRVVLMQGMTPAPHVVHHPNLIHPQPQHFQRPLAFSGLRPHPYSAAASPLSGTPTPPPQPPHHVLSPYIDYSSATPRALTPVQYRTGYYSYHSSPIPYASAPPPYALYPSPSTHHIPPPPPPTPAQEILNRTVLPLTSSQIANSQNVAEPQRKITPPGLVSSERECEAVAEALLCLRTSSNTD